MKYIPVQYWYAMKYIPVQCWYAMKYIPVHYWYAMNTYRYIIDIKKKYITKILTYIPFGPKFQIKGQIYYKQIKANTDLPHNSTSIIKRGVKAKGL